MEFILLWVLFSVFSGVIASSKKRSVALWAILGFFFGPFGLIVAFLPSQDDGSGSSAKGSKSLCKKCQQPIVYNAKLCPHCGTHFPYLAEPARSHVEMIEGLFIKGTSAEEIAATLNSQGVRPANRKPAWDSTDVTTIIQGHIA